MAGTLTRRALFGHALGRPKEPVAGSAVQFSAAVEHRIAQVGDACIEAAGVACRLCDDACNAAAIRFRPRLGGGSLVLIDATTCTGCGDCVAVCPAGAISISNRINAGTAT